MRDFCPARLQLDQRSSSKASSKHRPSDCEAVRGPSGCEAVRGASGVFGRWAAYRLLPQKQDGGQLGAEV